MFEVSYFSLVTFPRNHFSPKFEVDHFSPLSLA